MRLGVFWSCGVSPTGPKFRPPRTLGTGAPGGGICVHISNGAIHIRTETVMTHYSTPACRHENGPKNRPLFLKKLCFGPVVWPVRHSSGWKRVPCKRRPGGPSCGLTNSAVGAGEVQPRYADGRWPGHRAVSGPPAPSPRTRFPAQPTENARPNAICESGKL